MKNINYIKHLNFWFEILKDNPAVRPTHISLYMALFQQWNSNHFAEFFIIYRADIMSISKIGSKTTYANCLKDMHDWGWIIYQPSQSKFGQSMVKIIYTVDIVNLHNKVKGTKTDVTSPKSGTRYGSTSSSENGTLGGTTSSPKNGTLSVPLSGHLYKTNKQKHLNINNSIISKYDESL